MSVYNYKLVKIDNKNIEISYWEKGFNDKKLMSSFFTYHQDCCCDYVQNLKRVAIMISP